MNGLHRFASLRGLPSRSINSSSRPRTVRHLSAEATQRTAQGPPKRSPFRRYAVGIGIVFVGVITGQAIRLAIIPPKNPEPFSDEDVRLVAQLSKEIDKVDLVQKLRAASYGLNQDPTIPASIDAKDGLGDEPSRGWRELVIDSLGQTEITMQNAPISTALGDQSNVPTPPTSDDRTLTLKSTAGFRGIGVQRVFYNSSTKELVAVVWFGPGVSGWPNITHGGMTATLFYEAMAKLVAGPDSSLDSIPDTPSMAVTYLKPVHASNFYVLRASYSGSDPGIEPVEAETADKSTFPASWFTWLSPVKDMTKRPQTAPQQKAIEVSATLESIDGKVLAKAKGTWPDGI